MKTLRQQVAEELDGMREDIASYFEAGIPLSNHEHDLQLKLAASAQVILDLFPPDAPVAPDVVVDDIGVL